MILVTGGAGYIGSHCTLSLLNNGYDVCIYDNLSTGHRETIKAINKIKKIEFVKGNILNRKTLSKVFEKYKIDAVIHFAALSQVGESMKNPQKYYNNNVIGTISLLDTMLQYNVKRIVFSSTAATYGNPEYLPIDEEHPQNPINPYGQTKLIIEKIMDDYDRAYSLKSVRLRYFNVAGANSNSKIGEWHDPETHLIPNILKSTFNNKREFCIFGDDYDTKDGTCIRDYINIEDLSRAHILALEYLLKDNETTFFNLGTGSGNSVKEIFDVCKKITKKEIPTKIVGRREGDPAILIADNKKIKKILNWEPEKSLTDSILSAYNWEKKLQKKLNKDN